MLDPLEFIFLSYKFAKINFTWLNDNMKNSGINVKEKLIARYLEKDPPSNQSKSSNINVLLNRIAINKKNENRKKLYFSAAASTGLILFGLIIF